MKKGFRVFFILVLFLGVSLSALSAQGQTNYDANSKYGNGIVNSSGQWAQQIGTVGAQANRNTANQLFQQALQHEAQGIATLNPGLLSQALTESQQGIKADDQARHLAQTALQALQVGNSAGHVDLAGEYGTTEDQMRDLANNSSPYLPEVQSKLSSFGIAVNHDHSLIKSPFGEFPLDAGPGQVIKAASQIAEALGYSGASVADGVNSGIANAQGIAKKALADAQQAANSKSNVAGGAGGPPSAAADDKDPKKADAAAARTPAASTANPGNDPKFNTSEDDIRARALALQKSRDEMKKKLGAGKNGILADQSENLFKLVHDRYEEMDRAGAFLGPQTPKQQVASLPKR